MSRNLWPEAKLSELTSRIGDGIHGTPKYTEEVTGYPFVNGNNLKEGFISITADTKLVAESEYRKYHIEFDKNTLLMSINGTLGSLAKYRGEDIILGKSAAYIKCTGINVDFLYYFLQLKEIQDHLWNIATGSTIKNLSLASIRDLAIPVPSKVAQEKIISALSCLDAKIELNNRINSELEAMAKTLYDYWFVQFDFPDANGNPYQSSGGKMGYNKVLKRQIPEGWSDHPLLDSCQVIDCLHSKKPDYSFEDDQFYLLQLENILDNGQIDLTEKYHVSQEDYNIWTSRIEVKQHDIVMTNAGRTAAFAQIPAGIQCGIGRNITAIRPNTISPNYFFLSLYGIDVQRQILTGLDHGAFFKSFNVKGIKALNLLHPTEEVESSFEAKVAPIITKRHLLLEENQKLNKLRDWLLPMLMNGQVTVA